MKNSMKTMLAFVAGALALSACNNEDAIINDNVNDNDNGAKLVTLTAYQEGEGGSRAAIDGTTSTQIDWTENDKINYFGGGTNEFMELSSGEGSATGSFSGEVTTGANDYVLYPYNAEATCTSGTITTTIPSAQSVPAGTFDPAAALMVGKVNGESVQFYNAVGYIAITIPSGSSNITKMVITGNNNERLSGKVTISGIATNEAPTNIAGTKRTITDATSPTGVTDGVKYVEVTPNGTTTFTAGSTYYVAVAPDATLSKGIYVLLYDGATSEPANLKLAVKKSSNSLAMARAKVKKVALPTITEDDWKGMIALTGCYMAPFNIGATKSSIGTTDAYGNFYSFGEVDTKKDYSSSAYIGSATLTGPTDAATSNWGPDWRMATYGEWNNNISNSSFKGLPYTGYYYGTTYSRNGWAGCYWPSTPSLNGAYYLDTNTDKAGSVGVQVCLRTYGLSVRPVLATPTTADPNLLPGKFTVAEGKTVKFTKGNLQATYSTTISNYTWGFAANQWEYVGNKAGNTSITSDGKNTNGAVVDLFGWSTSATNYGINTSQNNSTYSGDFKDWGKIFDDKYFTLSTDEWKYLLNDRTQTNRFAVAMVKNVRGLLIFPDNYNGTTTVSGTGIAGVNSDTAFPTTSIPTETWTAMESAGVVFLPAAGNRDASKVCNPGTWCHYWSSTKDGDEGGYSMLFFENKLYQSLRDQRRYGMCVRLVSVASE